MIILKHLTIERFRLLRAVNLHFPLRGSILLQGPNESGKSTLLESIYFALYGETFHTPRGKRPLDDLISYGAESASVTLTLSLGTTELIVTRTVERGKEQQAVLRVLRLGSPEEEPLKDLATVNARIVNELGLISGEALRASCFVEQKGLDRLELVGEQERDTIVRKLLGLENLLHMTEHFQVLPEDEEQLAHAKEELQLAETQTRIPVLNKQLEDVAIALDAVGVAEELDGITQQESEIGEQEQEIKLVAKRRIELKNKQNRVQHLKRADNTLAEIIDSYDEIAEARRELPELEKQIADLERREREELPAQEKRVAELADLTRSFGTLQRMSNDLLTAVDSIKDLEAELKQHNAVQEDLKTLEEQISHAHLRLNQAQQALRDLEERRRAGRPQLEARLSRMKVLAERLATLRGLEERYTRRLANQGNAEQNEAQLRKVSRELTDTEQELELVEHEARQIQQQVDTLDKRWRRINVRRHLEDWHRLKGLAQGLSDAEQHVRQAHQHQEKLTQAALAARAASNKFMIIVGGSILLGLIAFIIALVALGNPPLLILALLLLLVAVGAAFWSYRNYKRVRAEESVVNQQMQEAIRLINRVVAERENAVRMSGDSDALARVEHQILSLGSEKPRTLEEAQQILQQTKDESESLAELQKRLKEKKEEANAAQNQVNVTREAVARLRKERAALDELRRREDWGNMEENLREEQAALERMHQEITLLAGQEGLPLLSINARLQDTAPFSTFSPFGMENDESASDVPELEALVDSTIKATERELASLDSKLDLVNDLTNQVKIHQDALDVLVARRNAIEERNARYQSNSPAVQIERAREQQAALRQALQSLQESLRLRVKPMGLAFGQAAIANAETSARKQLEELQITLGNKIMLQERQVNYTQRLKERQEALAELYKQLAKYSNSLGSWIVPLNPFAEALVALRTRCQNEIREANEQGILKELEQLQHREGAAHAKIELCKQDIVQAQERINHLLETHGHPTTKSFERADLISIWSLLQQYSAQDGQRLKEEQETLEQELADLEVQQQRLSKKLDTSDLLLNLEETQVKVEQLERNYQTKKRGNQLVKAVIERIMGKVSPRTEYHMQQILPLLTGGRYHDVRLATDTEGQTDGVFKIEVWDSAAGEYVSKSALSGGAADQLSLALRLAFAIATLPREFNTAPGFIWLDEPLSSFDRDRAKALADVVTGEVLSQHFEQVILVAHSSAFDPAMFPYHVYMENGLIVESNLPVVPNYQLASEEESSAIDEAAPSTVSEPVHAGAAEG